MIGRLLSWLEFRAWMEKVAVAVCVRCDCSLLPTVDAELDGPMPGPVLDPSRWPAGLAEH